MTLNRSQAQAEISQLIDRYRALSDTDRKTTTEASVVHQFINPLLRALGWPVEDTKLFKYELSTQAGRPDMTLFPPQGGTLFVEAKRFGLIRELAEARKTIAGIVTPGQLALPGMASDRTREEQQAINYAFENGGTWAILTNFEKLRLFNARRDWLVLSFEHPKAYLDQFDLLWQLSYDSIISGGLDLLSNQRHREDVDIDYLNFINTWRERLAQDLIAQPEANPWAFDQTGQLKLTTLRNVVQRVLDRLVVVRFAEDHLIAPVGTLYSLYEIRRRNPYTFSLAQFLAQLYRRFDEDHNSALFAPNLADQAVFSDEALGGLVEKLYEARYRAMSADIMGNTYEQYLGKTLVQRDGTVKTADNLETRKKQGSYYTPQVIVRYIVDNALGRYLYGTATGRPDGEPLPGESRKTAADIRQLQVLDAACGSGSFLIYAYQVLADFYRAEIARLEAAYHTKLNEAVQRGVQGMDLEFEIAPLRAEISYLGKYPLLILESHLYGVDLDSQAAEIATVNLIMRAMADQRGKERYLPLILNQNIKVGNALIGAGPVDPRLADHAASLADLRRLRRALPGLPHGPQRDTTMQHLTALTGHINADLDSHLADHLADPAAHRPFNWAVEFPEVFLDEQGRPAERAGFEIVIGNPPWEIVKPDLREYYAQFDPDIEGKLTRNKAEARIEDLNAKDPKIKAGWNTQKGKIEARAAYFRNSSTFVRQGKGDINTYKLFTERGMSLLSQFGRLGLIIPSGIYRDLGTKELRQT
ncbi:MAG TPA: DNA methyltransferase, partial [Anaerolineae bacterium]